ncbi:MAG TPA: hypothetical protein VL125_04540 [Pelobium sp.]|nr:hypothetical protein [Pelobium sp.]
MNNAPQNNLSEGQNTTPTTAQISETSAAAVIKSLAPKVLISDKDLARVKPYLDLLKTTIDAPGITNIALTGNYGSGKSTIINTFLFNNNDYVPLRISLASFGNVSDEIVKAEAVAEESANATEGSEVIPGSSKKRAATNNREQKARQGKKEELERLLEVSILQQIFYHVKPSAIPDSRFKRIANIKDWQIFWIALSFVLWVASALVLFKFNLINRLDPSTWHTKLPFDFLAVPFFLTFFAGLGLFAKNIVRLLNNSKINKVNIKGELELGDKLDKSVFNEHLEEILYFFERTDFNLVVIEDLDRFDSTDIFTKLRELNTLLNNSLSIKERKNHKEIVFLYAISDETFKDKNERVKFFEYIIPVIPFINPSNASEQLAQLILDAKIDDQRFKAFTEDLITFIDDIDMRLLTNIFHEYELYRDNLPSAIEQDKLFAIITYKNMYPEDFSKLHSRKGILFEFLSGRKIYVKKMVDDIDLKLQANSERIGILEDLQVADVDDLKGLYFKALMKKHPGAIGVKIAGSMITFSDLLRDEYFTPFSKLAKIEYYSLAYNQSYGMYNANSSMTTTSFADLEQLSHPGFTYAQRSQQINEARGGIVDSLKLENDQLRKKKQEIDSLSLSEIFEEVEIDQYIEHFSDSGLIRNLLLNGYIDENFSDFISLFHEVNMTADDATFEKRIKSGTSSPIDYKLTSTPYLVKKLNEKYFKRDVILNFDLVKCLLSEGFNEIEKHDKLFALLANEKQRSVIFIDQFISKNRDQATSFVRHLLSFWPGLWSFLETKSGYGRDKIDGYLKLVVLNGKLEDLVAQGSVLTNYISKRADFLSLFESDEEKSVGKALLERLNLKFEKLDPANDITKNLFDLVYEKSLYKINVDSVLLMLQEKGGISVEDARKANYSAIQQFGGTEMLAYVESKIDQYVQEVFLKIPENKAEEEIYVLSLLNNADVEDENKSSIISGQYIKVSDLAKIEDFDLQQQIVRESDMVANWDNVFTYYDGALHEREEGDEDISFDETLIDFLNIEENYLKLAEQKISDAGPREKAYFSSFSVELMMSNQLNDEAYFALMGAHNYNFDSEDLQVLDEEKIAWSVENHRVDLNKEMYDQLKKHFPGLQVQLVEQKQNFLAEHIDELAIDIADSASLLSSSELSNQNKILVYEQLTDDDIIGDPAVSRSACHLLSAAPEIEVSFAVMQNMFAHSNSHEDRINLLNAQFSRLSPDQIIGLLESMGGDYPEIFRKRHKPKFARTGFHQELFSRLEKRHMIKGYQPYYKDESRLRVYANY